MSTEEKAPAAARGAFSPGIDAGAGDYHRASRILHWLMAIGFAIMWLTGVSVTNVEGVPYFNAEGRQTAIRDFHKSVGLTLLALLVLRLGLRFWYPAPPLPRTIPASERRLAHLGHAAIYVTIVVACITGFAIADLHEYGNVYFGIELPQIFPTSERVFGWSPTPWAFILHAIVSYGLLALVMGHAAFVVIHKWKHGADLLARMLGRTRLSSALVLKRLVLAVSVLAVIVVAFAVRGFVTLGPEEEPRDYITTTPFGQTP